MEEMLQQLLTYSIPLNLQTAPLTIEWKTRSAEYLQRHEMYKDTFTREIVKIIIGRAFGTTINENIPFQISVNGLPKKLQQQIEDEDIDYLRKLIDGNLMEIALDSQFYGDGYVKKVYDKGIVALLSNFSTKAPNIIPIVTNKGNTVAYEVASNGLKSFKARYYVPPIDVARLNAERNGVLEPTQEQYVNIDSINVFREDEKPYEDSIYGGVVEGCYPDFVKFKWAIKALANTRVASSMLERFIIHNLGNVDKDEQKALKKALEVSITKALDAVKNRQDSLSPDILIANHIIPTTGDNATNNVSIQESNTDFTGFQNIDDIMIHIKTYMGSIGFNIEYTPYGTGGQGVGLNKDDPAQNSLQMEEQASQIRRATRDYIIDIVKSHIISKYNIEIEDDNIEVSFTSVYNHAKLTAEQQRMEAITNSQQVIAIIDQVKAQNYEDNEGNRKLVRVLLRDVISQEEEDREELLDALVEHIFTKEEIQEDV